MTFTITEYQYNQLKKIAITRRYHLSRSQAKHRGQEWNISLAEYTLLWTTDHAWLQVGKLGNSLTFSRLDMQEGWNLDNVCIITRAEMLRREGLHKRGIDWRTQ